jgi:hypothetical protein
VPREPLRGHLPGRGENRERDREVEAGALLAQIGWREVDRDPPQRPFELGTRDAASHPLASLSDSLVGKTDDRERRHTLLQVRFDLDRASL